MRLIDCAVYAPRFAAYVTRPLGWTIGLTLVLLMAHSPDAQVPLTWDASPSDAAVGYRLYYGTQSRVYTASIDVGPATAYTITELAGGQTYYLAVTSYDHTGESESVLSEEIVITLSPPEGSASEGVISIEAEAMALTAYDAASNTDASGGDVSSHRDAVHLPTGVATMVFPGPAGAYDIIVFYVDARDGRSPLSLTVNGEDINTWLADADLPDGMSDAVHLTSQMVARGIPLAPGDIIALEGDDQEGDFARLDRAEFVPHGNSLGMDVVQ